MKTKLVLGVILQLIGVASSVLISESLDPDISEKVFTAYRNEHPDLATKFFSNHLALMLLIYVPFGLVSLVLVVPVLMNCSFPNLTLNQKRGLATFIYFLTIPLISSVPGYFVAMAGGAVPRREALIFAVTPIALALLMCGSFGTFILATLPEHLNSKSGAWLRLIVGSALIFVAWNLLEILLRITYIK